MKIDLLVNNLSQTQELAKCLAEVVVADTIILLDGNLGSGKTTFMQGFGRALGISTTITSPTFTLIDEYTEGRLPLYHIDLYRLEPSQIQGLHLEEYWRGEDFALGVVAIEWASKLINVPANCLRINLSLMERSRVDGVNDEAIAIIDELPAQRRVEMIAQGEQYEKMLTKMMPKVQHQLAIR